MFDNKDDEFMMPKEKSRFQRERQVVDAEISYNFDRLVFLIGVPVLLIGALWLLFGD